MGRYVALFVGVWSSLTSSQHRSCILKLLLRKVGIMSGQVRGRTKDECWRNYVGDGPTRGSVIVNVIASNKQEAYAAMQRDNEVGLWTLDFTFTNVAKLMA
jgi:hypothetical protein